MATSSIIKNYRDSTILIEDGTSGTALNYTVQFEPGDFSFDLPKHETAVYDRGEVASVRKTQTALPTGTFSVHFTELSDASNENLTDILDKEGAFSAAVSTLGANADVYTVKITVTIAGTSHGDSGGDNVITFDDCFCNWSLSEGDPTTISVSFTCHGAVTRA